MKPTIFRTSTKHYAEKKLRTFPLPPIVKRRKLIKQTRPAVLQFTAIQKRCYPGINKFAKFSDMKSADIQFVRCFIAADWKLDLTSDHDFMVAKKILINSIIKN